MQLTLFQILELKSEHLGLLLFCICFYHSVKEAWLGVKYIGGQWLWENGMAATEQRYFREQPFNNVSSSSPICGKAVIEFRRKNLRKIYIEQEDCSVQLPVICQFSKHYFIIIIEREGMLNRSDYSLLLSSLIYA